VTLFSVKNKFALTINSESIEGTTLDADATIITTGGIKPCYITGPRPDLIQPQRPPLPERIGATRAAIAVEYGRTAVFCALSSLHQASPVGVDDNPAALLFADDTAPP